MWYLQLGRRQDDDISEHSSMGRSAPERAGDGSWVRTAFDSGLDI